MNLKAIALLALALFALAACPDKGPTAPKSPSTTTGGGW
jgi:predicted small lipoprotein YifL